MLKRLHATNTTLQRLAARPFLRFGSLLLLALLPVAVYADSITIPNTFVNGQVADADQVNANFSAVKTSVDDNDGRITTAQGTADTAATNAAIAQTTANTAVTNAAAAQTTANAAQSTADANAIAITNLQTDAAATLLAVCQSLGALGITVGDPPDTDSCQGTELAAPKTVFLRSQPVTGNLGGLAGADALCQESADDASLSGTYKAWLSSSTVDARDRLTHGFGAYKLPTGTVVAVSWADLVDGSLFNPINVTETGGAGNPSVWTSTTPSGQLQHQGGGTPCLDWTSNSAGLDVAQGRSGFSNSDWTTGGQVAVCSTLAALYCFEQ